MTTTTSPTEAMTQWTDQVGGAMRDWWDSGSKAWQPVWDAWAAPFQSAPGGGSSGSSGPRTHTHEHHHGGQHGHDHRRGADDCGCGGAKAERGCGCGCGGERTEKSCCDPCACCIPDADVVVHTRVGERRVIPFELCNERHRERVVTLAVGDWIRCYGPELAVRAILSPSGELTLGPCECRTVRLVVSVAGVTPTPDPTQNPSPKKGPGQGKEQARVEDGPAEIEDVAACATAYTDVRFEGCARPVRVAVVVHPASCDALRVECDCGCCC